MALLVARPDVVIRNVSPLGALFATIYAASGRVRASAWGLEQAALELAGGGRQQRHRQKKTPTIADRGFSLS